LADKHEIVDIALEELDDLLWRAARERWDELVLLAGYTDRVELGSSFAGIRQYRLPGGIYDFGERLPSMPRLRSLHVSGLDIGGEGAKSIAASLLALTSLNLWDDNIGDAGAKAIAASLPALTSLSLYSNGIGEAGARAIAASLPALTFLDLDGNEIGEAGARAIAASLRKLTSLSLDGNRIGDAGARAIASSLWALRSLDLRDNKIGAAGAQAITASLLTLTSLDLVNNNIGDAGAMAIAASLPALTSLALAYNQIGDDGAKAIAASLPALTSLRLSGNDIGDEGAKAIAASLPAITALHLAFNQIGVVGAKAIAVSLPALTSLDLAYNQIGDGGAKAVAASLPALTSLDLRRNGIGVEGAKAIALLLPALTSLDLGRNEIGAAGMKAIAVSLTALTSLELDSSKIGDEGAKAIKGALPALTSLDLSGNEIGGAGARAIATGRPALISLKLRDNNIGAAGAGAIAESLTNITSLDLHRNGIGDAGAKAIAASLPALRSLKLYRNKIGDAGASAIAAALPALRVLDLSGNDVGAAGATAIATSLRALKDLDLGDNEIGDRGAKAIAASLPALRYLFLGASQIGDDGAKAIAASLPAVRLLTLSGNEIGNEGAKAIAASLPALYSLCLDNCQIGDEGVTAIWASMRALRHLEVNGNQIGDEGAKAIAASLSALRSLQLRDNKIGAQGLIRVFDTASAREEEWSFEKLDIRGNPGLEEISLPEATETDDAPTLLAAYRRFRSAREKNKLRPLNELKLLVVGNEAVGKTSLLRYLIHDTPRDPSEVKTPGVVQHEKIEIETWAPDGCAVKLNVWDFGGQEVMRGTHRFFLTERSLYLLLLEDRREDDRSIHDWLKTIRNRGGESPILVVINKSDEGKQHLRLDEAGLSASFPNIVGFLRTSCNEGDWARDSIAGLRLKIAEIVMADERLRHVRDPIPDNWLRIKELVSEAASRDRVLASDRFARFCREPGAGFDPVEDENEQRALLRALHELGTIVAYGLGRDAPAVQREVSLLDPNWLTGAVYRILDKAGSVEQEGEFSRRQLGEWLDPQRYKPQWHEFILNVMQEKEIGLCFRLLGAGDERYLIPEALPPNRRYVGDWPPDSLRFRYSYGFLPPGLLPRLIVEAHRNLTPEKARWKTGVVLKVRDCPVLILADRELKRLDLQIAGPEGLRRAALNVVLEDLDAVHALNPEAEPVALVPLPDRTNEHVRYDDLLKLEKAEGPQYQHWPQGADRKYEIRELLDGVRLDRRTGREFGMGARVLDEAPSRPPGKRYYVSYAWNDQMPDGKEREAIVDQLCAAAEARGTPIRRDKNVLRLRDSISTFMNEIAAGDRVFTILSDKYLKSPFCMYELFSVWYQSRRSEALFLDRIRVYALPDAKIWKLTDRLDYAEYWKNQYAEVDEKVRKLGQAALAGRDLERFKLMGEFALRVGDLLAAIADHLQPRSFDDLVASGLTDD
jgi:internalin A